LAPAYYFATVDETLGFPQTNSGKERLMKTEAPVTDAAGQNWPKISIVTPSFNQGIYLEDCIRSILDQEYPNLEYFIIDGESSDESVHIIREYESRLSGWVSEPDQGQSDAINKGLKWASGDLVAWLNADDYYLPGALQTIAQAYKQYPGAPFYFGDGLRVDEKKSQKKNFFPDGSVSFDRPALINGLNYILQPATFIRRLALEEAGYLDINLHYSMDTDLWIRLSARGEPVPIQVVLAASREHGSTKTATGSFKRLEELRLVAEKHSGTPITPGYLCYFLDTLERYTREHEADYPSSYRETLLVFWTVTANLLAQYNARPDGFPIQPQANQKPVSPTQPSWIRRLRKILKNILLRKS
jgi:glycosyltransferase involved in cell wall biosynthesis